MANSRFRVADTAQQVVGSVLLAGPFVVTEEVWRLAGNMRGVHTALATFILFAIGYGALYRADRDRDLESPEQEPTVFGIPLRFLSLIAVSYTAVILLMVMFRAPATFDATLATTVKAISVGAIFSVVGAATADSLF